MFDSSECLWYIQATFVLNIFLLLQGGFEDVARRYGTMSKM